VKVIFVTLLLLIVIPGRDAQSSGRQGVPSSFGVVTVGGTPHPYFTEGQGVPCIVSGMAPAYAPLFSERLKQHVRFIYVDFKNSWGAQTPRQAEEMTMATLADEIDEVRKGLGLDKVCVVGHSSTGQIALEYAVRHPAHMSHGLLVGVTPYWNRHVPKLQAAFWEKDASSERKAVKRKLDEMLPNEALLSLSKRDTFLMRYVRNGPRYFYDASYDFSWALVGRTFSSELFDHYIGTLLADYDARPKLRRNAVPLLVVLGRYDYATPYEMWNGVPETIPQLTHHVLARSSHFPMLEEAERFDELVVRWLRTQK
jgi:proline iminopeptidase